MSTSTNSSAKVGATISKFKHYFLMHVPKAGDHDTVPGLALYLEGN